MLIYGHRGASASEPENTLRAFARAIDAGVDGLEFDVQVSADRVPVILHDRELARTTNGAGAVDRLPLDELQALDAGRGERIPTFAEVLELAGDRVHLDVEVKQSGIERDVLAVLSQFPRARWAISSFDWTSLERARALAPHAELWVLAVLVSDAVIATAGRLRATGVALWDHSYSSDAATRLRDAGLHAVIWTVNDPERARELRDLGAHAVCTDAPERVIPALA